MQKNPLVVCLQSVIAVSVFLVCTGFDWSPLYGEYMGFGMTYDGNPSFGKIRATIDATGIHGEQALAGGALQSFSIDTTLLTLNPQESLAASTQYQLSVFNPQNPDSEVVLVTVAHGATPPGAPVVTIVRIVPDVPALFPMGLYRVGQTVDLETAVQSARDLGHIVHEFQCVTALVP